MPRPQVYQAHRSERGNQIPQHVVTVAGVGRGTQRLLLRVQPGGEIGRDREIGLRLESALLVLQQLLQRCRGRGAGGEAAAAAGPALSVDRGQIDSERPAEARSSAVDGVTW